MGCAYSAHQDEPIPRSVPDSVRAPALGCGGNLLPGRNVWRHEEGMASRAPGGSLGHGHPGPHGPGLQAACLCFQRKQFRPETRRAAVSLPTPHPMKDQVPSANPGAERSGGGRPAEGTQGWPCSGPGSQASAVGA